MGKKLHKFILFIICFAIFATNFQPAAAKPVQVGLKPRWVPTKPAKTKIAAWQSTQLVDVKFAEGSAYRYRDNQFIGANMANVNKVNLILQSIPTDSIRRLFSQSEGDSTFDYVTIQPKTEDQIADLNLWYRIKVSDERKTETLINALNQIPDVEIAYPANKASPLPTTPKFTSQQGYIFHAPHGIDAEHAWTIPGGRGENISVIDIEYNFNQNHEDLPDVDVLGGDLWDKYGSDHGTATLGVVGALPNEYGITGILREAKFKFVSPCSGDSCAYNLANAINIARIASEPGDVIVIEQQTPVCNSKEYGPAEWDIAVFDSIKMATSAGIHVVEAAGNGNVNLDASECEGRFRAQLRDSGAIIVGAGAPPLGNYTQTDRSKLSYSSFGSRVSLQGWGDRVVSTGYGDMFGATPNGILKNITYTKTFNGTSSATAITAGVVGALSSVLEQQKNQKSPLWVREHLIRTGAKQQGTQNQPTRWNIGPRPDLRTAIASINESFRSSFNGENLGWAPIKNSSWYFADKLSIKTTKSELGAASIVHKEQYSAFDYQARMRRTNCTTCSNGLIIRGAIDADNAEFSGWAQSYRFQYTNEKYFSVWKIKSGEIVALKNWTLYNGIHYKSWNTLRVVATGSLFRFYINDTLVWAGSDKTLSSGYVGIFSYWDGSGNPGEFMVDWASLLAKPFPDYRTEESLSADVGSESTDWTDYNTSPAAP